MANSPMESNEARWLSDLRTVGAFLTILPLGKPAQEGAGPHGPGALAAAAWSFPIIGLLPGAAGGLAYALVIWLGGTDWLAAVFCVAAMVLLCGGLHEDGLGDFADGLGGTNRERRLAIMRDSQSGNFAIVALVLIFAGRIAAIAALAAPGRVFLGLLAAAAISRAAMIVVMHFLPPARGDGLGAEAGCPAQRSMAAAVLIAGAIALASQGFVPGLACLAAAAIATLMLAAIALNRLGGQTGDVLGAVQVTTELACLAALSLDF